nr:basic proline-rich protein-like [Aegilops tauschii subsp. strangulata]
MSSPRRAARSPIPGRPPRDAVSARSAAAVAGSRSPRADSRPHPSGVPLVASASPGGHPRWPARARTPASPALLCLAPAAPPLRCRPPEPGRVQPRASARLRSTTRPRPVAGSAPLRACASSSTCPARAGFGSPAPAGGFATFRACGPRRPVAGSPRVLADSCASGPPASPPPGRVQPRASARLRSATRPRPVAGSAPLRACAGSSTRPARAGFGSPAPAAGFAPFRACGPRRPVAGSSSPRGRLPACPGRLLRVRPPSVAPAWPCRPRSPGFGPAHSTLPRRVRPPPCRLLASHIGSGPHARRFATPAGGRLPPAPRPAGCSACTSPCRRDKRQGPVGRKEKFPAGEQSKGPSA